MKCIIHTLGAVTDQMTSMVQPDVIQDGEAANLALFDVKIYFKQTKSVFVDYFLNSKSNSILKDIQ